mmetsp:Transcript_8478/g.23783  ORF Transcript_8478/g.23783 Transcript_8478/m.23783 type:complete len:229 (-) Transcript_8478:864-1550(-)
MVDPVLDRRAGEDIAITFALLAPLFEAWGHFDHLVEATVPVVQDAIEKVRVVRHGHCGTIFVCVAHPPARTIVPVITSSFREDNCMRHMLSNFTGTVPNKERAKSRLLGHLQEYSPAASLVKDGGNLFSVVVLVVIISYRSVWLPTDLVGHLKCAGPIAQLLAQPTQNLVSQSVFDLIRGPLALRINRSHLFLQGSQHHDGPLGELTGIIAKLGCFDFRIFLSLEVNL